MLILLRDGAANGQMLEVDKGIEFVDVLMKVGQKNSKLRYVMTFEEQEGRRIFRPTSVEKPTLQRASLSVN